MQNTALNQISIDRESNAWAPAAQDTIAQSVEGYLVSLYSLTITCGVGYGEKLACATDIVVGDNVKLTRGSLSLPVHYEVLGNNNIAVNLTHSDLGNDFATAKATKAITLMSKYGKIVHARVLENTVLSGGDTLLLLDQWIDTAAEYTFIAASEAE